MLPNRHKQLNLDRQHLRLIKGGGNQFLDAPCAPLCLMAVLTTDGLPHQFIYACPATAQGADVSQEKK